MTKQTHIVFLLLGILMACSGPLIGVNVEVVDEKTLLERQILGSYEELSKELVMIASVRGVDEAGKIKPAPFVAPGKERALQAAQSREFNRDDIDRFKKLGCAGENVEGLLVSRACSQTATDKKFAQFLTDVLREENSDRKVILARVVETSENLKMADLPKLQRVFAQMNRDAAKSGEWIQTDDGKWIAKP